MKTLIRLQADPATAGVLRHERSPFEGEVIEQVCVMCGGTGVWIGGDEEHVCFCVRDRAEAQS